MSPGAIVVETTAAGMDEAEAIANALLNGRLAACVQLAPIESLYQWDGRIERQSEVRISIKTRRALYAAVEAAIREVHSYDVPQIVALTIDEGSADYLAWIAAETAEESKA